MPTWTLRDHGRDLAVHDDGDGRLRLTLDGVDVDEARVGRLDDHAFELDRMRGRHQKVKVERGVRGAVAQVALVESGNGELPVVVPFVPPEDTRARRLYDLREAHPRAWAARHVLFTGAGLVGLGAVVSALLGRLLPSIDWSWLPDVPDVDLPALDPPDWLRYLDPFSWLRRLTPDWDLGWLADLPWGIIVPLLVACGVALSEYGRHRARQERQERTDEDG